MNEADWVIACHFTLPCQTKAIRGSASDHNMSPAKGLATVPKSALGGGKDELQFADPEAFKQAMRDLRSDPANINW